MRFDGQGGFPFTAAFLRVFLALFVTQLAIPVLGQTGWQPCGTGTCVTSGNVGVGTTSPATKLHVSGTVPWVRLTGSGANWTGIQFENTALTTPVRWALYNGSSGLGGDALSVFDYSVSADRFTIASSGNVGIGTTMPQYKLAVNGTIGTKEVIVTTTGWADYVFKPGYALKSLSHVEAYIRENQRLPDMPSESEVKDKGVGLADMQVKLLAKIEELTLHMIELDKQNKELRREIAELKIQGANR